MITRLRICSQRSNSNRIFNRFNTLYAKVFIALTLCVSGVATGLAGTFPVFGPDTYVRETGSPVTVTTTIETARSGTYQLRILNGGLEDAELEPVSSSVIILNGVQIVGPNEFNQNITQIEKEITLNTTNNLGVELRGAPGGGIVVSILGEDNVAPTIVASVTPSPDSSGWHH